MGFTTGIFWIFKTLCSLWFISLCGFLLVFMAFFGENATHRLAKHTTNRGNMAYQQTPTRQI
jgi:hypothetical protein